MVMKDISWATVGVTAIGNEDGSTSIALEIETADEVLRVNLSEENAKWLGDILSGNSEAIALAYSNGNTTE